MKTLPGISAFLEQRRLANWKRKLKCPPRDFRGSPIHSKPPNVTLPSSAMKQTDAITIASLFSIAAMYNYAGQTATVQLQCPFERAAHFECTRVRTKSVSRGTRNFSCIRKLLRAKSAIVSSPTLFSRHFVQLSTRRHFDSADILFNCRRVDIDRSNAAILAPGKTRRPATHSPALVARPSMMAMFCINS